MFVDLCGVSKSNSSVDYAMLEYCIREDLKLKKPRMMAALDPVKLVIDNYPEGQTEMLLPGYNRKYFFGGSSIKSSRSIYNSLPNGTSRVPIASFSKLFSTVSISGGL